jgi:uncharacterized protein
MELDSLDLAALKDVGRRHDIERLALFGSYARGEAVVGSDIDLLARFSKRKSLMDLVRIERELSEALGRTVDLVTESALSPYLRDRVLAEQVVLFDESA